MKDDIFSSKLFPLDSKYHFTLRRELHRISDQVEHDLPQTSRIPQQSFRYLGKNVIRQLQALLVGTNTDCSHGVIQIMAQVEFDSLHVKFSRLDLGEVQDVVDPQQKTLKRKVYYCPPATHSACRVPPWLIA
jgi:hypothetical protein